MDVVLEEIHYNPEVFSKIVEDFKDFVERTEPGFFWKAFCALIIPQDSFWEKVNLCQNDFVDFNEQPDSFWKQVNMLCNKMSTDKMEEGLKVCKKEPGVYLKDFYEIQKMLEDAPTEEKIEWLDKLPCHLYIFYHTVISDLWKINSRRYTTALRDTGKASLL